MPLCRRKKKVFNSSLPLREREICARLREARIGLRLTQEEFANQVGIERERLASYEDARAPLRTELALRICQQFGEQRRMVGYIPLLYQRPDTVFRSKSHVLCWAA